MQSKRRRRNRLTLLPSFQRYVLPIYFIALNYRQNSPHRLPFPKHKHWLGFEYTLKNKNLNSTAYDCKYKQSCKPICEAKLRFMFQSGNYNEDNPVVSGRHSRKCCILNGGDLVETYNWDGRPKEELSDKCDVVMKAPDVSAEMTLKTEELACFKLTETPEMIWRAVRAWCDTEFGGCWHGLLQNQVTELVRKARNKLGKGDTIGTVENTPQYNTMTDTGRPFLHCSLMLPHPKKPNTNMRTMIFANPANLGLLKGPVDLYCNATFAPCTPDPFYQCLIIMIFEYSTSSYVPVLYALMTHKCEELYSQVFAQIVILTGKKSSVGLTPVTSSVVL